MSMLLLRSGPATGPHAAGCEQPPASLIGKRCGDLDPLTCEGARAYVDRRGRRLDDDRESADSWTRFYRELDPYIRAAACRRRGIPLDLEDAVQEAWLAVIVKLRAYRPGPDGEGRLPAWLAVVVRHRLANLLRDAARRSTRPLPSDLALASRDDGPAEAFERRCERAAVRVVLDDARGHLPGASLRILELRWIEGMDIAEIAKVLGLSETRVRDRHRRALRSLRGPLGRRLGLGGCGAVVPAAAGEEAS